MRTSLCSVVVIYCHVVCLQYIATPVQGYFYRQPRSDLTLLSVIPLQRGCEPVVWKLSQYEMYEVTWNGKGLVGKCQLKFLAENVYNVVTQYKVCFRFLDYYVKNCIIKVRFSETAWMYFNRVHDTREFGCKDRMPIDQWCSDWNGEAWLSLHTALFKLEGRFTLEVTAIASTSLTVATCVGISLGIFGGLLCIFATVRFCKSRQQRENARRTHLNNTRFVMSHRRFPDPNRVLLSSSASFSEREPFTTPLPPPNVSPTSSDISPSPTTPRPFRVNMERPPSLGRIGRSSPLDEGPDNSPPSYHTINAPPSLNTDDPPPSYNTVEPPPTTQNTENPPPTQNTENPPPSYEECLQYAIT